MRHQRASPLFFSFGWRHIGVSGRTKTEKGEGKRRKKIEAISFRLVWILYFLQLGNLIRTDQTVIVECGASVQPPRSTAPGIKRNRSFTTKRLRQDPQSNGQAESGRKTENLPIDRFIYSGLSIFNSSPPPLQHAGCLWSSQHLRNTHERDNISNLFNQSKMLGLWSLEPWFLILSLIQAWNPLKNLRRKSGKTSPSDRPEIGRGKSRYSGDSPKP